MLDRVAVLSDIHGALPPLEAVLAEPDVAAADLIVLTGDIAAGPQPVEVLDLLATLGERACWVRGNADRELVEARAGKPSPIEVSNWAAGQLRDDHVARLAGLPLTVTLPIAGLDEVLFCHATPRDDEEVVLVDTRMERWSAVFAGLPAEVGTVVCGHTHMPFTRLVDRRLVVNPGSVGMPYGGAGAWWALLGPGVQLRRTGYDIDAACARVGAESGFPDAAEWANEYLRSRHTDADALAVFAPRDGR
ncbi:YfcE family phosphodiesterase [Micromonospora globispora]|uniref:YfcE family phosphodiesterase n=1 Tax=Micromonospora globispora TaxID=1450148 RepID=A0A317JTB7_9ACTN|nr:metallophosphoesterase family protein [Micromonospora globispora]PWU44066.1 YfcE family phosphodiesterase [Micromonospora globispora]PWU54511.1 YfcE family phosphodiesterase [Micromonospora globispora]RQW92359.1 YfcE family phosphodiesterase [Micromonospora globispora]